MAYTKALACQEQAEAALVALHDALAQFPDYDIGRDLCAVYRAFNSYIRARLDEAVAAEKSYDEYMETENATQQK